MGLYEPLAQEFQKSQGDRYRTMERQIPTMPPRAHRWIGEMEEIAASFRAAGLPDGFHLAAAEIYRELEQFKDPGSPPSMDEVTATLGRIK